jgi:hypothetical protein
MAGASEDAEIELYPTSRVLAATDLREVARPDDEHIGIG